MLAVLSMASCLAQADVAIVSVATPGVGARLGASAAADELVVGDYLVTCAMLLITGTFGLDLRQRVPQPSPRWFP